MVEGDCSTSKLANGPAAPGQTPHEPTGCAWKNGLWDVAAVLARWSLGVLFVYLGLNKALHPVEFLKLVRQYELVASPFLLNSIAATLPWFEVFCGLLLLAGVAVRGASLVLVMMLAPFTAVVLRHALALAAAQKLPLCAIRFDCGCGAGAVWICHKLAENVLLIVLAAWLAVSGRRRFSLRFGIF
ncbi:MAG TPA: MauE/DoxX family redox-associated membrane protein [Verrucomicrobiae bacterium]|nr:MauE/DoxX family redox-associated membrane protein [Verrucomicrobiae bacterium]